MAQASQPRPPVPGTGTSPPTTATNKRCESDREVAVQLVDQMLKTKHPKKIGMDLNGMETMRDFGVMEAQILYLVGVRPLWDRNNLAYDVELIPREELKRPRVDVFVAMGGMYKENFPTRVELIDKAIRLASAAQESDNYVRAGTAAIESRLKASGFAPEQASQLSTARIFGTSILRAAAWPGSPQAASAGRIIVATPGVVRAATIVASAVAPTSAGPLARPTQSDIGRARLSISLVSGALYLR